ncbi:MAG: hypothetical protein KAH16_04165 [Candidatus Izimaplasma sp.]|nr:hypothetical protein [Candidatus Izimaplasma bacterium]
MSSKKGLKYYSIIFLVSVLALGIYVGYLFIKEGSVDIDLVYSYALVPVMFIFYLFASDKIIEKIFPSKTKKEDSKYKDYIKRTGTAISKQCDFSIEEYRRLRGNPGFQKSLDQAFRIFINGETKDMSFAYLEKKFKKKTNENEAMKAVIEEVKKMMENS